MQRTKAAGGSPQQAVFLDRHDFTISPLHFDDAAGRAELDEEVEEDAYERMISRNLDQS